MSFIRPDLNTFSPMSRSVRKTAFPRLGRLLSRAILLVGLVYVLGGVIFRSVNLPFTPIRIEREAIIVLGLAIVAFSKGRGLPSQFSLFFLTCWTLIAGGLAIGYHSPRRGDMLFGLTHSRRRFMLSTDQWIEYPSSLKSVAGIPVFANDSARQFCPEFDFTYHLGPDSFRVMPGPKGAGKAPEVWFLGCSFTLGLGVEDDQTYPYLIASRAWPDFRVRNFGVAGFGTTHTYIVLRDSLKKDGPKPEVVFYGWIDHHLKRNYLRKSWFSRNRNLIPRFEVNDGKLIDYGLVPPSEANLEDGPELDNAEFRVSVQLIREMARLCAAERIPFVMLVLKDADGRLPLAVLEEPGLDVLDVRHVSNSFYPVDGHPRAAWHLSVANAIVSHLLVAKLTNDSRLFAPGAFPAGLFPESDRWQLWAGNNQKLAQFSPVSDRNAIRLEMLPGSKQSEPWQVQLKLPVNVEKDHKYVIDFQVRADQARVVYGLTLVNHAPFKHLDSTVAYQIKNDWTTLQHLLIPHESESNATFVLFGGGNDTSFEIRKTTVREDGKVVEIRRPALHWQRSERQSVYTDTR